jgi:hypothetical protein
MTLLQRILEMVEEDNVKNADIADRQNQLKNRFADIADKGDRKNSPKDTETTISEALKINNLEKSAKNAVNVACMREVENHLPSSSSSSSYENKKINISYARASNNVSKTKLGDCNQCPAAGFWDYMGTGMWCFHRAYFLGKAGHPRACDTAKHDCPLNGG